MLGAKYGDLENQKKRASLLTQNSEGMTDLQKGRKKCP